MTVSRVGDVVVSFPNPNGVETYIPRAFANAEVQFDNGHLFIYQHSRKIATAFAPGNWRSVSYGIENMR